MQVICPDYSEAVCGQCQHGHSHEERASCPAICGINMLGGPCVDITQTR
jgi:hypothetical protein